MSKSKILLLALVCCSIPTLPCRAQLVTNVIQAVPPTILETLEAATGTVIIKYTEPVGVVSLQGALVSVECRMDEIPTTKRKEYGIVVGITLSGYRQDDTVIDYVELNSLLSSLNYLSQLKPSTSAVSSYDASYTTKGGLRVTTFSSKSQGDVEFSLRNSRIPTGLRLVSYQFEQLQTLVAQAKARLDVLRKS